MKNIVVYENCPCFFS